MSHCVDQHMERHFWTRQHHFLLKTASFSHITVALASLSFRFPSYKPSSLALGGANNSKWMFSVDVTKNSLRLSIWGGQRWLSYYICPKNVFNFVISIATPLFVHDKKVFYIFGLILHCY